MHSLNKRYKQERLTTFDRQILSDIERLADRLQRQAEQLYFVIESCNRNETIEGLGEMVAFAFNAKQFTPQYGGGGGLPPGKYKGVIVNTSPQDTHDQFNRVTGGYLALELTPIEGPMQGTKQTDRLNLFHSNPKVVEIANKQLSAYCHVTGKFDLADTQQLCNIPFLFEIAVQTNKDGTPNEKGYTEVTKIWDIHGNEPAKAGSGPQAGATTAASPAPPETPPAGVEATGGWGAPTPPANTAPVVETDVPIPDQGNATWGAPTPAAPAAPAAPAQPDPATTWGQNGGGAATAGWGAR